MKVVHLISTIGPGGTETFVKDLAIELNRLNVKQEIWSLSSTQNIYNNDSEAQRFECEFREELSKNGVDVNCLEIHRKSNLYQGIKRLGDMIRNREPDLVHVHIYWGLLYGLFHYKKIPFVFTHHGGNLRLVTIHRARLQYVLGAYIAICQKNYEMLKNELAGATDKIVLLPNGIETKRFKVNNRILISGQPLSVIAIGRMIWQKNYPMMLRAFRRVIDSTTSQGLPNPTLRVVGDGPFREVLERQVDETNLREWVSFLGIRNDIPDLLKESDIYVMSSSSEGMPIVLLEALASGLPIVATDVGGITDILTDSNAGFLVASDDDKAMAEAILKLVKEPETWQLMSDAATICSTEYTIQIAAKRHFEIYQTVQNNYYE